MGRGRPPQPPYPPLPPPQFAPPPHVPSQSAESAAPTTRHTHAHRYRKSRKPPRESTPRQPPPPGSAPPQSQATYISTTTKPSCPQFRRPEFRKICPPPTPPCPPPL